MAVGPDPTEGMDPAMWGLPGHCVQRAVKGTFPPSKSAFLTNTTL